MDRNTNFFLFAILIASMLMCSAANLNAQSLSGRITDTATHESIPGVIISIPKLKLGATTDSAGYYTIAGVPNGTFNLEAQYLGYTTSIRRATINGVTT